MPNEIANLLPSWMRGASADFEEDSGVGCPTGLFHRPVHLPPPPLLPCPQCQPPAPATSGVVFGDRDSTDNNRFDFAMDCNMGGACAVRVDANDEVGGMSTGVFPADFDMDIDISTEEVLGLGTPAPAPAPAGGFAPAPAPALAPECQEKETNWMERAIPVAGLLHIFHNLLRDVDKSLPYWG